MSLAAYPGLESSHTRSLDPSEAEAFMIGEIPTTLTLREPEGTSFGGGG